MSAGEKNELSGEATKRGRLSQNLLGGACGVEATTLFAADSNPRDGGLVKTSVNAVSPIGPGSERSLTRVWMPCGRQFFGSAFVKTKGPAPLAAGRQPGTGPPPFSTGRERTTY